MFCAGTPDGVEAAKERNSHFINQSKHIKDFPVPGVDYEPLKSAVWDVYAQQLLEDYAKLENHQKSKMENENEKSPDSTSTSKRPKLTGAGKYAPREKKQFDVSLNAVSELCKRMFPIGIGQQQQAQQAQQLSPDSLREDDVIVVSEEVRVVKSTIPSSSTTQPHQRPKRRYREIISALNRAPDVPGLR